MSKSSKSAKSSVSSKSKKSSTEKTIEEKYQKLDVHAHVLKKPGMYVGGIKKTKGQMWIYNDSENESDPRIILKEISYVPAFYKICDEIIVNARDRTVEKLKVPCTIIKITVDKKTGRISVWNNGDGVDVVKHKEHKIYVPSMLFGETLSSTQYVDDDNDKRVTGGTNGLGAKLANIYSTEFTIETLDAVRNKKFKQKFTKNMYKKGEPKITDVEGKKPYTQISFIADFERFGIKGITTDMVRLLKKRAYDIAMGTDAKVYFNNKQIKVNNLQKYTDLYFPNAETHPRVLDIKSNPRWKIGAVFDKTNRHDHENISFINGICTYKNGNHVDHVVNQIVARIRADVEKKVGGTVKPSLIKENLIFFVDSVIVNPVFNSQTKEQLDASVKEKDFGSTYKLTEAFIKALKNTGIVEHIVARANGSVSSILSKLDGKKSNKVDVEKLSDAEFAGGKRSAECGLFLTEGDSAKALAMAGFNIIGRDKYGVFPLRGKLKKVSGELKKQDMENLLKNKEIEAIMKILGLKVGKVYDSIKDLRYGFVVLMTDQDVDGYHIKGLLMNFINYFWPSLLIYNGFIKCFPTPIAKATKGAKGKEVVESFYNIPEFEEWKKKNKGGKGWHIKYYKGLATSDVREAHDYFCNFEEDLYSYYCPKEKKSESESKSKKKSDPESESENLGYKPKFKDATLEALSLAFDPKRTDDRKIWMNSYDPTDYLDCTKKRVSFPDFVNKELREHSVYNASRAIPNIMDGFKPSQRKIYCTSADLNLYTKAREKRVAQLSARTSEFTSYHHGETSLQGAIIKMAQNFVGSNNLNLFVPDGLFGSRLEGGDDAGAARYIHTYLDEIGRHLFNVSDNPVLNKLYDDDGKEIEPMFYAPIIPMILVNGVIGIGTGYSSNIPPCYVRDIVANIQRLLRGEKTKKMSPYFRHYTGKIEKIDDQKFLVRGKYEIHGDTIHITDLPIGSNKCKWIEDYKTFLSKIINEGNEENKAEKTAQKNSSKAKGPVKGKGKGKGKAKTPAKSGSKTTAKKGKRNAQKTGRKQRKIVVAKSNHIGKFIKTYDEHCTDIKIDISIEFYPGKLAKLVKSGQLEKDLGLCQPIALTNMYLFDSKGKIIEYNSYGDILKAYAEVRLELYQKRKDYLLGKWRHEMDVLAWKVKFIEHYIDKKIVFSKKGESKTRAQVIEQLEELGFPKFCENEKAEPSYYYTEIGIWSLTKEKVEKLKKELANKKQDIKTLKGKTPSDLWTEEIDVFMEAFDVWEAEGDAEYEELLAGKKKTRAKKSQGKGTKSKASVIEI